VRAQFDLGVDGFALTSLTLDGNDAVAGPSMLPTDYRDQGGLWRLGNEMPGCTLDATPRASGPVAVTVLESTPLQVRVSFTASSYSVEASLAAGVDGLDLAVTTGAAQGTTRTVSLALAAGPDAALETSSPAGWQARPAQHVFDPTFFPAVSWAQVGSVAVLLRQSTGVRMSTPGLLELMVARDARSEQCDIMGGTGSDTGSHRIEWRMVTATTPAAAEVAAQAFARPLDALLVGTAQGSSASLAPSASLASVSGEAVLSAIKPAERGAGVIVRALLLPGPGQLQLGSSLAGAKLELVDLAERDVQSLGTAGATVRLDPAGTGSIVGLRLH
jgi:hypothetical protein